MYLIIKFISSFVHLFVCILDTTLLQYAFAFFAFSTVSVAIYNNISDTQLLH